MIVVYYGVNLSLSLPFCLSVSLSLFIFPSSSSAYAPILISISSIVLRLISSGLAPPVCILFRSFNLAAFHLLLLYLSSSFSLPRPLPASQYRPASPLLLLLLLSGLYFSDSDVPPVANIVFLPPPLDMAKEAICALLAILEHFFEAFSPLDLFFAPLPFRPVPRPFPAFLHPVPSSIPTYSISRPSAQVNIIPAWFPSLSETSARAVFIFRASVA